LPWEAEGAPPLGDLFLLCNVIRPIWAKMCKCPLEDISDCTGGGTPVHAIPADWEGLSATDIVMRLMDVDGDGSVCIEEYQTSIKHGKH